MRTVRRMFFSSSTMKTVEGIALRRDEGTRSRRRARPAMHPARRRRAPASPCRLRPARLAGASAARPSRAATKYGGSARSRATMQPATADAPGAPTARRRRDARRPRRAHQRDVVGARVKVRPAVERIDAVRVAEPDLAQHLLDRLGLGPDLADQLLHVRRQQRRVQRILRKQRADELLVVLRQPIGLLVA